MRAIGQKLVKFCTPTHTDTHTHTTAAKLVVRISSKLELLFVRFLWEACIVIRGLNIMRDRRTRRDRLSGNAHMSPRIAHGLVIACSVDMHRARAVRTQE